MSGYKKIRPKLKQTKVIGSQAWWYLHLNTYELRQEEHTFEQEPGLHEQLFLSLYNNNKKSGLVIRDISAGPQRDVTLPGMDELL